MTKIFLLQMKKAFLNCKPKMAETYRIISSYHGFPSTFSFSFDFRFFELDLAFHEEVMRIEGRNSTIVRVSECI